MSANVLATKESLDTNIANIAALIATTTEAIQTGIAMPSATQPVLDHLAETMSAAIAARASFAASINSIARAKLDSDLAETDFGCLGEGPLCNPKAKDLTQPSEAMLRAVG